MPAEKIAYSDAALEFVKPNEDMFKICRLYLEKYELLADADKEIYRQTLRSFSAPMFIVNQRTIPVERIGTPPPGTKVNS